MVVNEYELNSGDVFRSKKNNRHYIFDGMSFRNEFGTTVYVDCRESYELVGFRPRLEEKQWFNIVTKHPSPCNMLLFELPCGWRFRVYLDVCYKFSIPFWFKTADPRVEWAEAKWHGNSGKILRHLKEASFLSIEFDAEVPVLVIDKITSQMKVPSVKVQ